jgi:hypothetical protein
MVALKLVSLDDEKNKRGAASQSRSSPFHSIARTTATADFIRLVQNTKLTPTLGGHGVGRDARSDCQLYHNASLGWRFGWSHGGWILQIVVVVVSIASHGW